MLWSNFTPSDYFHSVDPYASFLREHEARRVDERRRGLQLQRRRFRPTMHFDEDDYCNKDDDVEVETPPYRDRLNERQEPNFRLIRGADGLIYRVPMKPAAQTTGPMHALVRGLDGRVYRVPDRNENGTTSEKPVPARTSNGRQQRFVPRPAEPVVDLQPTGPITSGVSDFDDANNPSSAVKEKPLQSKATRPHRYEKVTVIVEDASDSETEDDDVQRRSVWRNRLPSPGNWMEPVESVVAM